MGTDLRQDDDRMQDGLQTHGAEEDGRPAADQPTAPGGAGGAGGADAMELGKLATHDTEEDSCPAAARPKESWGASGDQPDMAELYSPKRVTLEAEKFGLKPGEAVDLTTGWDFDEPRHREAAWKYILRARPKLLIGSPMCTMFSALQNMTQWTKEKEKRLARAKATWNLLWLCTGSKEA